MQRRVARPAAAALALLVTLGAVATLFAFSSYSSPVIQKHHDIPGAVSTFDVTESTLSAATSGCELCQQTGLCDHAFKGTPGQFCLTLVSGLACCCPQDAQCVVSNSYNCRCRRVTSNQQPHYSSTTTTTTTTSSIRPMQLFPLFAMLLCVLCCVCAARDRNRPETEYPANQPVYITPQYGATQDTQPGYQYGYPSAPSAPPASPYGTQAYDPYAPYAAPVRAASPHNHSSGNAFAAGAFGAVAGLAGGMLAGSMFGGGGSRPETTITTTTTSYFGGDSGFSTFSGDTGGGGGDDGGYFGGDSVWPTAPLSRDPTTGAAFVELTDAALSADATGCRLCEDSGVCDHAYRGTPGQFCLALVSGVPCCCPQDAECVLSTASSCRCRRTGAVTVTTTTTTTTRHGYGYLPPIVVYIIVGIIALLYSFYCILMCCCRSPSDSTSSCSQYGSINNDSNNSYGSVALSALGGFAAGMLTSSGRGDDVTTTTTTTTTTMGGGDFAGDAGGGDDFGGDA